MGWHLLDSGALYRLVALYAQRAGIRPGDAEGLARAAGQMQVRFSLAAEAERVHLGEEDVTDELRGEDCGESASQIAAMPEVRSALLGRQRAFARPPGLVADGRDMGTVVFPDARLKVFLTASPEERALRRHKQLKDKGIDVSLPALSRDIARRDERDAGRQVAPLIAADDARILDSTGMTPEAVTARIRGWLEELGERPDRA
jgi:cytidylate kinase